MRPLLIVSVLFLTQLVYAGYIPNLDIESIEFDLCLKRNNDTHLHCYVQPNEAQNLSTCLPINKTVSDITGYINSLSTSNNINCGDISLKNKPRLLVDYSPCGIAKPKDPDDCFSDSDKNNSCCFYTSVSNPNITGCYLIDTRYEGQTTWNDLKMSCSSVTVKTVLSTFIITILALTL